VVEEGSDIARARALHEKAHNICIIVNSVNFQVRHEAEVTFTTTNRPRTGV
jgi:organic hydroperoxide reductase OsmC/OhrA